MAGSILDKSEKAIRNWLFFVMCLVIAMIVIGGATRLTNSGLSITEWAPIKGALPPLSLEAWQSEFQKYKNIPEFSLEHPDMDLAGFKFIYFWEWSHRQLGRFIGLAYALPLFYFMARRRLQSGQGLKFVSILILIGLQGAIGWWMVSSGLEGTRLDVLSYRLAIHLGLAFVILGLIAWYVLKLGRTEADLMQARRSAEPKLKAKITGLMHLSYLQILLGALVAGIDAGRTYTDWPLMGGAVFPVLAFDLTPFWTNFFENEALVQFNHRLLGYILFGYGMFVWWRSRGSGNVATKRAFDWMAVMLFGQLVIGIATVIYAAPWNIAIVHQFGAVVLVTLILRARFLTMYPKAQSVRGGA